MSDRNRQEAVERCIPWRTAAERLEQAVEWLGEAQGAGVTEFQNRVALVASEARAIADKVHEERCRQ